MKQSVLHQKHLQLKAKMTDFQGWQMPLQYSDIIDEYHAVRTAAGLFDVCCLGRIEIDGAGASALLQRIFTRDLAKIPVGAASYGLICSESGAILDNAMLFHLPADNRFLLSTNAMNVDKIVQWLKKQATPDTLINDVTQSTVQLALQGPHSDRILAAFSDHHLKKMKPRTLKNLPFQEVTIMISRTGCTGEHGYELFAPATHAERLWNAVMEAGRDQGILPCGYGSRNLLRLEMGFHLYGCELDETRTPLEAGLGSSVDFKKDFIGKDALLKIKADGIRQQLVGFELFEKGIPKTGGIIFSDSREVGVVTTGIHSPHCRKDIGLGYVTEKYAQPGQEIEIEVKDQEMTAKIVHLPFFRRK